MKKAFVRIPVRVPLAFFVLALSLTTIGGAWAQCTDPAGVAGTREWLPNGAVAPTSGLIHHWKMDDSAPFDDEVGSEACTLAYASSPVSVAGKDGTAIRDNGAVAECDVTSAIEGQSQFSLAAWIKKASVGGNAAV